MARTLSRSLARSLALSLFRARAELLHSVGPTYQEGVCGNNVDEPTATCSSQRACLSPLGPLGFNSPNIAQRHALQ